MASCPRCPVVARPVSDGAELYPLSFQNLPCLRRLRSLIVIPAAPRRRRPRRRASSSDVRSADRARAGARPPRGARRAAASCCWRHAGRMSNPSHASCTSGPARPPARSSVWTARPPIPAGLERLLFGAPPAVDSGRSRVRGARQPDRRGVRRHPVSERRHGPARVPAGAHRPRRARRRGADRRRAGGDRHPLDGERASARRHRGRRPGGALSRRPATAGSPRRASICRRCAIAPKTCPLLSLRLLEEWCAAGGRGPRAFTQPALALLSALTWPGNLAELQLVIERAATDAPHDAIQIEDVLPALKLDTLERLEKAPARFVPSGNLRDARLRFERDYIAGVLQHHGWRMARGRAGARHPASQSLSESASVGHSPRAGVRVMCMNHVNGTAV